MPLIKWRDSYSVGVEQFDQEHAQLVDIINELYVIIRDKQAVTALDSAMDRLIEYTRRHFMAEEDAMEQVGYPFLDEHKEIHLDLERQVLDFQKQVKAEKEVQSDFYVFLRDWLIHHIIEEDKKYSSYMA